MRACSLDALSPSLVADLLARPKLLARPAVALLLAAGLGRLLVVARLGAAMVARLLVAHAQLRVPPEVEEDVDRHRREVNRCQHHHHHQRFPDLPRHRPSTQLLLLC